MRWSKITSKQSSDEWFDGYVRDALRDPGFSLPAPHQRFGDVSAKWYEIEPGLAFISTVGGTVDDRAYAEFVVRNQLRVAGYAQAEFTFDWAKDDPFRKEATWDDIEEKAKRLRDTGAVQILRNGYNNIVAQVQGDNDSYQTEIMRQDPYSRVITQWSCECPWDQFAFQRTRQWKKFEGRPCSHVLATFWKSQATPLDEDVHPAQQAPAPGQQMSLFGPSGTGMTMAQPGGGMQGPGYPGMPNQMMAPPGMQQQMMIPGMMPGMATGTPPMPSDPGVIPPFPQAQPDPATMPNPASVPGLKQPTPTNPVQYPGGTFSSWRNARVAAPTGFTNGVIVSTNSDDWGEWQGRTRQGEKVHIPAGSPGEVLGTEPVTGMVNVLFMNKALGVQEHGEMQPWGATAWFFPSQLTLRPDIRPPGPAVKRR